MDYAEGLFVVEEEPIGEHICCLSSKKTIRCEDPAPRQPRECGLAKNNHEDSKISLLSW